MSEYEQAPGDAERLAEIMAWHGMARYAEPDALAPYAGALTTRSAGTRPAEPRPDDEATDAQGVSTTLIEPS